jgi:hypothetical protein
VIKTYDCHILGNALPDSLVKLIYILDTSVSDSIIVSYKFDGHMSPASGTYLEITELNKTIYLNSSNTFLDTLELKVWGTGNSMISILSSTKQEYENKENQDYRFLIITTTTSDYSVINQDSINTENLIVLNESPFSSTRHYFHINGKVVFNDINQNSILKGLYKSKVFWFFIFNNDFSTLYKPYIVSGNYESTCDINGNFDLIWQVDYPLSERNSCKLIVYVQKSNYACNDLVSGGGDFIIGSGGFGTRTFAGKQYLILDIDGEETSHNYDNLEIKINSLDGAILRNLALGREFHETRYQNLSEPSTIGVIRKDKLGQSNWAGVFHSEFSAVFQCTPNWIEIRSDYCNPEVILHEYGHYVHFRLAGLSTNNTNFLRYLDWANTPSDLKEGWAMFVSFANRSYNSNKYGDDYTIHRYHGDTEKAPFCYNGLYRFSNLSYYNQPGYCKFACYLQNVYDDYSENDFMHIDYDGKNNDDIGLGQLVYSVLDDHPFVSTSTYHNYLKSVTNQEMSNSINDIWEFMNDDEHPMRPAQITSLSLYQIAIGEPPALGYKLSWNSMSYANSYNNQETGYHIYKWDNDQNEWYLYQTTNLPELYTGNYSYKVSAYNSSGDSYGERIVQPWCSQTNDVTNIKEKEIDLRILPNPIINSTQIEIFLPFDSFVSLDIFDYSGQFLENILKEFKESGLNQICYSPNIQLTNGVYFIKLSTWNSQGIYLSKFKNIIYEKK